MLYKVKYSDLLLMNIEHNIQFNLTRMACIFLLTNTFNFIILQLILIIIISAI